MLPCLRMRGFCHPRALSFAGAASRLAAFGDDFVRSRAAVLAMRSADRDAAGGDTSISVCLMVRNEARLLARCLASITPIADEIVVVDTGSTDGTRAIAADSGARVIRRRWDGDYAAGRNTYIAAARCAWILVIDGDETIARRDLQMVRRLVTRRAVGGYRLVVRNYSNDFDLAWRWIPNDGAYPAEERRSRCAGWAITEALRLFRNVPGLSYARTPSTHVTPLSSLEGHGTVETRTDVVIHHFQHLKGGSRFIVSKQRQKLAGELLATRRSPVDPRAHLNAAKTLFALGRDAEAIACLRRVTRRHPRCHDAFQLWGMIAFDNGDLDTAAEHLQRAVAIDHRSADGWALLGIVHVEAGRASPARHALQRALAIQPRHLLALNSLGVLHEDLGQLEEARRAYRAALKLHGHFAPALVNLARVRARGRSLPARTS